MKYEYLQGDFMIDHRTLDHASRSADGGRSARELIQQCAGSLGANLAAKVAEALREGRVPLTGPARLTIQFIPDQHHGTPLAVAPHDFHSNTARCSPEFHAFMAMTQAPGWREKPFEWRRACAKEWNFARLYRGGEDSLRRRLIDSEAPVTGILRRSLMTFEKRYTCSKEIYDAAMRGREERFMGVPQHPNCRSGIGIDALIIEALKRKGEVMEKLKKNIYYVGTNPTNALGGPSYAKESEAVTAAKARVEREGFEVQIYTIKPIRRVRRKPQPIVVEKA